MTSDLDNLEDRLREKNREKWREVIRENRQWFEDRRPTNFYYGDAGSWSQMLKSRACVSCCYGHAQISRGHPQMFCRRRPPHHRYGFPEVDAQDWCGERIAAPFDAPGIDDIIFEVLQETVE